LLKKDEGSTTRKLCRYSGFDSGNVGNSVLRGCMNRGCGWSSANEDPILSSPSGACNAGVPSAKRRQLLTASVYSILFAFVTLSEQSHFAKNSQKMAIPCPVIGNFKHWLYEQESLRSNLCQSSHRKHHDPQSSR